MKRIPRELTETLTASTRVLQIITAALLMGCVFSAATGFVMLSSDTLDSKLTMLVALAAGTAVVLFSLSYIVGSVLFQTVTVGQIPTEADLKTATENLQKSHIIRCALIEGGCMLNLVVFLLDKSLLSVYVMGLGMFIMLTMFPTLGRVVRAVENRLR